MSCLESQSGLTEPCSLLLLPMASHCSCTGKEMMLSTEISAGDAKTNDPVGQHTTASVTHSS